MKDAGSSLDVAGFARNVSRNSRQGSNGRDRFGSIANHGFSPIKVTTGGRYETKATTSSSSTSSIVLDVLPTWVGSVSEVRWPRPTTNLSQNQSPPAARRSITIAISTRDSFISRMQAMSRNLWGGSGWAGILRMSAYRFCPTVECHIQHPNITGPRGSNTPIYLVPGDELRFENPDSPVIWLCLEKAMRDNGLLASSIQPYGPH